MRIPSYLAAMLFPLGWIFLFVSLLFSPGSLNAKYVPDIRIEHSPPATFPGGERIHLKAGIVDTEKPIEARCYFKYETEGPFLFVGMSQAAQGYECWLPVPASHIDRVEYVFVAVDSMAHVVRSNSFQASIDVDPGDHALPSEGSGVPITVKSDIPLPSSVTDGFSTIDQPIYQNVPAEKQHGLRVAIYNLSQDPGYGYGFFGGFKYDLNNRSISPIRGYRAFTASATSGARVMLEQGIAAESALEQSYPDITGSDWSGYFFVVDNNGNLLSDKTPVAASVYHDGSGNVSITVSNHQCPGRNSYSRGRMDSAGFILIYDDCDDQDWTTHWRTATSTSIQLMDFIDPPYYKKLNVLEITRPNPSPTPAAPTLVSPLGDAVTDFRSTLLKWNAAKYAVNYQVQLGNNCNEGVKYQTSSLSYSLIDLEPGGLNYWKVRGENSIGEWGPWSACWSFTTMTDCPGSPAINSLLLDE